MRAHEWKKWHSEQVRNGKAGFLRDDGMRIVIAFAHITSV